MKLNIFSVLCDEVESLREKLDAVGMFVAGSMSQGDWQTDFYYSPDAEGREVSWAKPFREYFEGVIYPESRSPFAVFLFARPGVCFAITYGKSHFYVRPFCDYDFGIELAKRIAREDDTRQTSSKRFSGRQRKSIRSYSNATHLSVESGESVDYIQAGVLPEYADTFGSVAKFGTSAQLTVNISVANIGSFLNDIQTCLQEDEKFRLPRTTLLTDEAEVARFDAKLLDAIQGSLDEAEFVEGSYDLYGVDFVFGGSGRYTIRFGSKSKEVSKLDIQELRSFISQVGIKREEILRIKVVHQEDDRPKYTNKLKRDLEFLADNDRVVLTGGRWMRFNQDYLEYLDEYVRGIEVEETEPQFKQISAKEGEFNTSSNVGGAGYEVADKNFDIFKTRVSTPIEAWDLKRDNTVYAVKFGTAQTLGYVCDQAIAVLELLRNRAEVKKIPHFERYCLWLGYEAKQPISNIADTRSIILKQKIEAWARKAESLGIVPVVKVSQRIRK